MGVEWRAHDQRLEREVAIKILPECFANDPERRSRFAREAEAVATLSFANNLSARNGLTFSAVETKNRGSCRP
jgi:hypothetical protein